MTSRLLAGTRADAGPLSLAEHLAVHGPLPAVTRGDAKRLREQLTGAGLRGRGGAGFPTARKLAVAHDAGGGGMLLANGCEGEPASLKDQTLLGRSPHLVLDGAQLAARAMRAREVVLVLHAGAAHLPAVRRALKERSGDHVPVRLVEVPHRYVSGEASAVASAALGRAALPALHDEPLAARGLRRKPMVVLNVETLAGLAVYLRRGADWYAEVGTDDEPGSLLLTVRSTTTDPTVLEVPVGTAVHAALVSAGVEVSRVQAVLVGGYFGAWLPGSAALDLPLSHAGLRGAGGTLGAGLVLALDRDECGLRATAQVVRYLAGESAKQCGPCVNGLPLIATAMEALAHGAPQEGTLERLERWCGLVSGRGLCHHPDGVVTLVRSALRVFATDVEAHGSWAGCTRPPGSALAVPVRCA